MNPNCMVCGDVGTIWVEKYSRSYMSHVQEICKCRKGKKMKLKSKLKGSRMRGMRIVFGAIFFVALINICIHVYMLSQAVVA